MITVEEYKALDGKDVILYGANDRSVFSTWASKTSMYDLTAMYRAINSKLNLGDDFESKISVIGNYWIDVHGDDDQLRFRTTTIRLENIFLIEQEAIERHVCLKLSRRKW